MKAIEPGEATATSRQESVRAVGDWTIWLSALGLVTAALVPFRDAIGEAPVAILYLLLVLGASARRGLALGITVAGSAFLALNFFFVPPYHTLVVAEPADWLVLTGFLVTGVVGGQLLARSRRETGIARRRAAEIDRLSALGAETLNAARPEEALAAIAEVIRTTLDAARCEIHLRSDDATASRIAFAGVEPDDVRERSAVSDARLVDWVATNGRMVVQLPDGATRIETEEGGGDAGAMPELAGARVGLIPLRARGRTVGVLRIAHTVPMEIDDARRRFLTVLSYYAALGAERVRLTRETAHVDALRHADALKNALLASVSHDLRTPLTTIKGLAHEIALAGDDRAITIEEEVDRLNHLVADLLDLSRLNAGAVTLTTEVNAADDLIGAVIQRVGGAFPGRTINATLDPHEPLLAGRFDFSHSLRVLGNLLENALKYSPPGSAVDLSVRRQGDALEFRVADRGTGVPAAEREQIFEPFYRPAGSIADAAGAGLGLSIARRFAEAQGGSVTYEPRPDGGSVFTLRLPAADVPVADAATARSL